MPMKNPVHPGALAKANLDELNLRAWNEITFTFKPDVRGCHNSTLRETRAVEARVRRFAHR
jgi:hypothetical protein